MGTTTDAPGSSLAARGNGALTAVPSSGLLQEPMPVATFDLDPIRPEVHHDRGALFGEDAQRRGGRRLRGAGAQSSRSRLGERLDPLAKLADRLPVAAHPRLAFPAQRERVLAFGQLERPRSG